MNDLQKLNKIIGSLEEQASQVREFNGVLRAVNDARAEIDASNITLSSLSKEHEKLIEYSYGKLDSLDTRLSDLENRMINFAKIQENVRRNISELKTLTPDQYELGQSKILLKLFELNYLSPEQYEEGRLATEKSLEILLAEQTRKFEDNKASLRMIKTVSALSLLTLVGSIGYFIYVF